jgi:hypothetical protein
MTFVRVFRTFRWLALLNVACNPPAAPQPRARSVEGAWSACFRMPPAAPDLVCGLITVGKGRPVNPDHPTSATLYPVTSAVPLAKFGSAFQAFPAFGVLATTADSGRWHLQIGFRDRETTWAADDGSIVTDELIMDSDSIFGPWARTCFAGCPERGTLVLRHR